MGSLSLYFEPLGVDPLKVQNFDVVAIDPLLQVISYGWTYGLVGQAEDASLPQLTDPEQSRFERTPFDIELNYRLYSGKLSIYASAEFPWLFSPPIAIPPNNSPVALPIIAHGGTGSPGLAG